MTKYRAAMRAAKNIKRCKTEAGKRNAVLRWCEKIKGLLSGK